MNLSRNLSITLIGIGAVIIVAALLIHFLVTALILPHLNIYLAIVGVIVAAVGVWGMVSGRQRA